jgi:hypothetical protein
MVSRHPIPVVIELIKISVMKNIDSLEKKRQTEHFIQLIRIAFSNNIISRTERELLYRMGGRLGFSVAEVEALIEKTVNSDYFPPDNLTERFGYAFDLVKMTLADGSIDKNEMKLVNLYIAKAGFKESEMPGLILLLIKGIRNNRSREELFVTYMKNQE